MGVEVVSLTDRPELLEAAFSIGPPEHEFMQHDPTGWLYTAGLMTHWSDFGLVLIEDGVVVARAMAVPFCRDVDERPQLPLSGWDGVIQWAAEDVLAGRAPTAAAALEITVDHERRGSGLSRSALDALKRRCIASGISDLLCPVRPTAKAQRPAVAMADYIREVRPDGLPVDPWLRVHVRAGGEILGIAPFSMTVIAALDVWRRWTGLPFDDDGQIEVPGGLVPVVANQAQGFAVYVEPNVWVLHHASSGTS